jgi:hypothetical protein
VTNFPAKKTGFGPSWGKTRENRPLLHRHRGEAGRLCEKRREILEKRTENSEKKVNIILKSLTTYRKDRVEFFSLENDSFVDILACVKQVPASYRREKSELEYLRSKTRFE